jgi:hypothetical protein
MSWSGGRGDIDFSIRSPITGSEIIRVWKARSSVLNFEMAGQGRLNAWNDWAGCSISTIEKRLE